MVEHQPDILCAKSLQSFAPKMKIIFISYNGCRNLGQGVAVSVGFACGIGTHIAGILLPLLHENK